MLSIIIPAKNEEKNLRKLLPSILKQGFKKLEVIVADDNSTDKTAQVARKLGAKVVKTSLGHPGKVRNFGARFASHPYILFLDADVTLPKDFLKINFSEFMERNLSSATVYINPISRKIIDKTIHYAWNIFYSLVEKTNPHACGFCIFTKKDVFEKLGGFDTTVTLAEDHHYVKRAGPFAILKGPKINVSVRRLDKEGRAGFVLKMMKAGLYRTFFGEIRNNKIEYDFKHQRR